MVALSCLLGIVTVVGLQPQRTLSDLRFPFQTKSGQDDQAQTPTNVIVTFDDRVAHLFRGKEKQSSFVGIRTSRLLLVTQY